MISDYWVYVPAQYDPDVPTPYMIFNDGGGYLDRKGSHPALNVIDNLIHERKIPVMIAIFVNPGDISGSPETPTWRFVHDYAKKWNRNLQDSMRSTEYDTVSDRYARFLNEELIPRVATSYNLRKDGYSHAITGSSSGGIAAFNAAWQQPDQFSRVITWIGSFTAIQWHEDPAVPDGGQDFPEKVLREDHRNLRVWVSDGDNDQENDRYGSWPLANIRLANALKLKSYDFRFSFGTGSHRANEGAAEFPDEMIWLWRDYNPALTTQTFTQDPAEAAKPPFRVSITNR
jgi:enterochelin esterase family protein